MLMTLVLDDPGFKVGAVVGLHGTGQISQFRPELFLSQKK